MRARGLADLPSAASGDHLCWIFDSDAEFSKAAADFLSEGLERGERLVFVADQPDEESLYGALSGLHDARNLVAAGTLILAAARGLYEPDGGFDYRGQVERYAGLTAQALADGYTGLRVAADATILVADKAARARFIEYELAVDRMMSMQPMTAMCAYNASTLGSATGELCVVHPRRHVRDDPGFTLTYEDDVLRLDGEIDVANRDLFEKALHSAAIGEGPVITIDLCGLDFVDVGGIFRLDRYAAALARSKRSLRLLNATTTISRCAQILRLPGLAEAVGRAGPT